MRIGEEKTSLYTINGLLGMDLRHTATREHATYMQNLLCVDGALTKRKGICDLFSIENESKEPLAINGIYDYLGTIIVHAGQYLFNCGSAPLSAREPSYTPQKISSEVLLENRVLDGCVHNGRLWLVSNGALVYYNGTGIYNLGEGGYVPTTREAINSISGGAGYKNAQAENVLSTRRKNKIRGTKSAKSSYELDCFVNEDKSFSLSCQMDISLNDTEAQSHYIAHTTKDRITGDDIAGVVGGSSLSEVAKIFDGTGTTYGFDALSEVNVFLNEPVYVESLVLNAQVGSTVPRIKLTNGALTVYESSELSGESTLNITSNVKGQMIDAITLYGNDSSARIKTITLMARKTYEGEVELIFSEAKVEMEKAYYPKRIVNPRGEALSLYTSVDGSDTNGAFISFSKGLNSTILNVHFEAPCYNQGRDNIQITFSKKDAEIPKISLAKECKTDTGGQILALCLNDTELCFTDGKIGFTYAPRSHYMLLGGSDKITALCQMENYGVGVYKKDKSFFAMVNEEGIKYNGAIESNGCASNRLAVTMGKDTLTMCESGVFGTEGEEKTTTAPRSSAINTMLKSESLENAFCLEHDGRLYIFLNEKCLVCDTRYKVQSQLKDSFEYEWFLLSDIQADCGTVLNGEMYLGTKNGKIRTLGKGFYDISYKKLYQGEYLLSQGEEATELYLSDELNVESNAELSIENAGVVLLSDIAQLEMSYGAGFFVSYDELFYKDGTARLFTGMEIFAIANDEIYLGEIVEINEYEGIISTSLPCENEYSVLFKDSKNAKITIKRNGDCFKMYENESELLLVEYDNASMLLTTRAPIVAKYESARLCPDGVEGSKSLHRIILDLLPSTSGEVILGYTTNKSSENGKRVLGKGLDFSSLDLGMLDLGARLQRGCVLRCFERGFSSIIVKITSPTPTDFALNGISLAYTKNGLLSYDRG